MANETKKSGIRVSKRTVDEIKADGSEVQYTKVGARKKRVVTREGGQATFESGKKVGRPRKAKTPSETKFDPLKADTSKPSPELIEYAAQLQNFPEMFLGIKPYQWQYDVLKAINNKECKVALKAANGSGKTSMVAACAVIWHCMRFPESTCVTTAGVFRQVKDQLFPYIRKYVSGLNGGEGWTVNATDVRFQNGSKAIGFSTSDGGRFEGWHRTGSTSNLLMIVDEAKTVPDTIAEAISRCQPSRLVLMSSPGATEGFFYRAFTKEAHIWDSFTVTSYDCPHIPESWINEQFERYGKDHPLVRSMVFGEFMDIGEESVVVPYNSLQFCLTNPPTHIGQEKTAFCDFAAGGDENVLAIRVGNKIDKLLCWTERDTMSAVGRFIMEFQRNGLKPEEIYADAGGLGIPMCDALSEAAWDVHRVNNGERAYDDRHFANRGAEIWFKAARAIELCEVILPDDDLLHSQLTTRRTKHNSKGKLQLEPKDQMRSRGLPSPDRADAVLGAISCGGAGSALQLEPRPSFMEALAEMEPVGMELDSGFNAGY